VRHGPKNQLLCQCGRYYNTLSRLMLHQREECQDFKRFQCDFCLKWFKRRSHLNRHKKLHDAELLDLEPAVHKQKPKAKGASAKAVAAIANPATDLEPPYLYTSEIKVEEEAKYNLRTQESPVNPSDYPSTSRQKTSVLRERKSVSLEQGSENEEPEEPEGNGNPTDPKKALANSDAMIALQQLASISTARSLQHLVQNMGNIDTSSLVPGRKLPRQSSKRSPTYESNRCPLCARVYRSQTFLNEHMRKEHSVLI
ncbi:hypothetical protein KR009_008953, partial [Drosophila setifemur]